MPKVTDKQLTRREGAPTKYDPASVYPKLKDYLVQCGKLQTELPTIEGLADYLEVDSDTIRNWTKKYPEFFVTIKKLADKQKNQFMNDGMYGGKEVNAAMAIFLLKCNHKMNDGSGMNVNVSGEKVIAILGGRASVPGDDSSNEDTKIE